MALTSIKPTARLRSEAAPTKHSDAQVDLWIRELIEANLTQFNPDEKALTEQIAYQRDYFSDLATAEAFMAQVKFYGDNRRTGKIRVRGGVDENPVVIEVDDDTEAVEAEGTDSETDSENHAEPTFATVYAVRWGVAPLAKEKRTSSAQESNVVAITTEANGANMRTVNEGAGQTA